MCAKRRSARASKLSESPVAVIDIGSNSIRLVVFDGLKRVPATLFNEKVTCRLGSEIHSTGELPAEAVEMALTNLTRFSRMAEAMGCEQVSLLATAAARDATNGGAFLEAVQAACGRPVSLLRGEEEARLSALGVLSGLPGSVGIMGDLGGGSLELVALDQGQPGRSTTLKLGPLRFLEQAKNDRKAVRNAIDETLSEVDWLGAFQDSSFHAVGGAWRNLALLHMTQCRHPLRMVQGYSLGRNDVEELTRLVSRLSEQSLLGVTGVSRRRAETLPYAALLLNRILKFAQPKRVVFSAFGLREGFLFDQLACDERKKDPLLFIAAELSRREGGFVEFARGVARWLEPLFPERDPKLDRLSEAACHLSNIAWRENPDYRASLAFQRVFYHPFSGVDHKDRAFLALAAYSRYAGDAPCPENADELALLSEELTQNAKTIGQALRLAYTLSAGLLRLLGRPLLQHQGDRLDLFLPDDGSVPAGDAVERRLQELADTLGAGHAEIHLQPVEDAQTE